MSIKEFIDESLSAVDQSTTLAELASLIKNHGIRDCPVIDANDTLQGIIYQRDLLHIFYNGQNPEHSTDQDLIKLAADLSAKTVEDLMSRQFIAADEEDTIATVASKMLEAKLSSLPVVKGGRFVGMISQAKVFTEILEQAAARPKNEAVKEETPGNKSGNSGSGQGIDIDAALAAAKQAVIADIESKKVTAPPPPPPAKSPPTADTAGPNKRFFKRVDMEMPVAFKATNLGADRPGQLAKTVNVSAGGMMILVKEQLPANTVLEVALDIYQNEQPLKSTCRVVRCTPAKEPGQFYAGLIFLAISVEERKKIIKYLDEKSPD